MHGCGRITECAILNYTVDTIMVISTRGRCSQSCLYGSDVGGARVHRCGARGVVCRYGLSTGLSSARGSGGVGGLPPTLPDSAPTTERVPDLGLGSGVFVIVHLFVVASVAGADEPVAEFAGGSV